MPKKPAPKPETPPAQKMLLVPAHVVGACAAMLQQNPAVVLYLALMAAKEAPEQSS